MEDHISIKQKDAKTNWSKHSSQCPDKKKMMSYAEIGASLQQELFWSIVVGELILLFLF